jgi:epoxyqueuosine reductase
MSKAITDPRRLLKALSAKGYQARLVPVSGLPKLQKTFSGLLKQADPAIRRYVKFLSFLPPQKLPQATSVLVLARDQPILRVAFKHRGKTIYALVPPSYYDYYKHEREVRGVLKKSGNAMARSKLPQKFLAVHSRLAKYGRNNIVYLPKWGSFAKLFAFWTDIPAKNFPGPKNMALAGCRNCRACAQACPSGAIKPGRFLINAGRCITLMNEEPPEKAFPGWVKPEWHNALVGCLRCQALCPANRAVLGNVVSRGRFNSRDTAYLLKGSFKGAKAKKMQARLGRLGLELSLFPRNLRVLVKLREAGSRDSQHKGSI